jgi:predicted ATPase
MPDNSQFATGDLDPDLLSHSFQVSTNWCVVTGASCSGKTTIINQLSARGCQIVPEAGRQFFEAEIAKGRTIEEIRKDRASFTLQIYDLMLSQEHGLCPDDIIFLDRGLPDALAFFRFAGLDLSVVLEDCFQHRYAHVFMLDRLPYQQDGVRTADDAVASDFELGTLRDYRALGYDVVRVPVMLPEERVKFVLETVRS